MKKSLSNPVIILLVYCLFVTVISYGQDPSKFSEPGIVTPGINIHFTKGHEKDLDMIADAGFKYIRMDFGWQSTEREKGRYDWSAYDELTANLAKRGIRPLYILDYSNSLYEEQVESKDPLTGKAERNTASPQHPESIEAFAKWAAAAALHFRGKDIVWEIWNEPNIFFWRPVPDVEQYNKLALATCKAVKTAVPEAVIIGPATSQLPVPFIESFLATGIMEYLDAVSVHPYRKYSLPPESATDDYKKIDELIAKYTPAGKSKVPVISGEWGYNTSSRGISPETQAAYIVRMQLSNLLYGIPFSVWYDWKNDGPDPEEWEHNFGTVTTDLQPKPSYIAIKTMSEQLRGFKFVKRAGISNGNDYVLLFRDSKGNGKLVAWTTEIPHSIELKSLIPGGFKARPLAWDGKPIDQYSEGNQNEIKASGLPQYITLPAGSNF